ncbi:MAG: CDP-alcohol phosphatidyltransferase family protein [Planctomycetota bacterium]|jgi:CDP-diacylglycerol--serine O-phosphatidyltransferase
MRRIHPLPTALTLCNFGCGFIAIVIAARSMLPDKGAAILPLTGQQLDLIYISCACIFVAMLFDMLDGKVARMTGSACQFGAEMDSLADVVTFGIAPAVILSMSWIRVEPETGRWWNMVLGCGFVYAACACIRLARYNVESDVVAKDYFRGLPSPAAGGALVSMFLLVHRSFLHNTLVNLIGGPGLNKLMAAYMLLMGLLMVTRVRYAHVSNKFLSGRKHFTHLVVGIFFLAIFINYPVYILALLFNGYALLGLLNELAGILKRKNIIDSSKISNIINIDQFTGKNVSEQDDDRKKEEDTKNA